MAETVAFLFADLAGSTRLIAAVGAPAYTEVLRDYRRIIEEAAERESGRVVDREGDGLFLVLPTAAGALRAAADAQRRLGRHPWPRDVEVSARMGIHVGEVHPHEDGYVGLDINRAARVGGLAHGGQVLVSESARLLAADTLDPGTRLRELGEYPLKGLDRPERIHQLLAPGLREDLPPLTSPRASDDPEDAARVIAVLPFEALGSAGDAELLALGLHNDLLTELSKVPELTVISRTSVLRYRSTETPIPRIARELNVGTILEGTVQSAGSRIRLNVQMIDGINDAHRWAESYDRELTTADLFDIQADLTRLIARSLEAALVPARRAEEPSTTDMDAYRLTARGRQQVEARTPDALLRAIDLFEEAVERDPTYVDAWVGLADALALTVDYRYDEDESLLRRAQSSIDRALHLDPNFAGAYASLGLIRNVQRDGPASLRALERAIALRPSYADAHNWRSWVSQLIGDPESAFESGRRAVELDPLSAESVANLALAYIIAGRPEQGLVEARRSGELSPWRDADLIAAIALYELGRFADASDVLETIAPHATGALTVPWAGRGPDAALALTSIRLGLNGEARAILRELDPGEDAFNTGLIHLALDEPREALAAFDRLDELDYWACLVVHHFFRDAWHGSGGTEARRRLLAAARRSWQMESPEPLPS